MQICAGQCFTSNYHQLLLNLSPVSGQEILDRSQCLVLAYRLHIDGTGKEKLEAYQHFVFILHIAT